MSRTNVQTGLLRADELAEADRIMRLAFGSFLNMPDPMQFMGDMDYVHTRFKADPQAAFAARDQGRLIGAAFASHWGSVGFFGPLIIHPDYWDQGVGQMLMQNIMACFERWDTQHMGLYTFANSPKHISLYQKFGFWPRALRAIMAKQVNKDTTGSVADTLELLSAKSAKEQARLIETCADLCSTVYPGLDLRRELSAVQQQGLGDTVLLQGSQGLAGFAICHTGAGTEAGSDACYIKFAAVACNEQAENNFSTLLQHIELFAVQQSVQRVVGGVSAGRTAAYQAMQVLAYKPQQLGVTMHRPNEAGYDREEVFVIDDWR